MSILSIASNASAWRGYEYYINKKILSWKKVGTYEFNGFVSGSDNVTYQVNIHIDHPKKSTCSCPHAEGIRIICKHKVALFFAVYPEEAVEYIREIDDYEREEEEKELERYEEIVNYVKGLTKADLREALIEAIVEAERKGKCRNNCY